MRYIVITISCGYCGYDEEYYLMFSKETTNEAIIDYACELLNDYVEKYEWLAQCDIPAFFENCTLDWVEVFEDNEDFNYHIEEFEMA